MRNCRRVVSWLNQTFNLEAYALRDLGLRDAEDEQIFQKVRQQGIVILIFLVGNFKGF